MVEISNEFLSVQIATKGAELQSIFHLQHKQEYLWCGDAAYWGKKSPVLFPIVGGLKNNQYQHNGVLYKLNRHGFARDEEFVITKQTNSAITFTLTANEQTKIIYPFDFVFDVQYQLNANKLTVSFIVENKGNETMYFSVGAHPAFAVPLDKSCAYDDYMLCFSHIENAELWPLDKNGLIEQQSIPYLNNTNELPLSKSLFYGDALVFKNLKSTGISLQSNKSRGKVDIGCSDFKYLGIWAAKDADFVCIEPWCGIADSVDASGVLSEKEGIISLDASTTFEASYTISLS